MTVKTNKWTDPSPLDRKAESTATRIAQKHGLRDRAKATWHSMANELLEELQPAIEEQARTEADQASKTRLRDVLALPEAEGREDLAKNLALDTDSTAEQVQAILRSTPKRQAHDPLATLMQGLSPGISSDDGSPEFAEETDDEEAAAQAILNA